MARNNIEQVVVSKIIEDKDMTAFLDDGITPMFFVEERWHKAYSWINEYQAQHGVMPLVTAFVRAHPNAELLEEIEEPVSALVAELIERRRMALTREGLKAAVEFFDADDIDATIAEMTKAVSTINVETSRTSVVRSTEFIGPAVQRSLTVRSTDLLGIPTGFPTIDESTGGMQNEQFLMLIANPKAGKTTIAVAICIAAQRYGKRGMLMSTEMSNFELEQRYQSIGAEVNLTSIQRGQVSREKVGKTPSAYERLRMFEEEVLDLPDLVLVHDVGSIMTLGGVAAKIDQHQPDFVVYDGVYLIHDENGEPDGSPQALTIVSRGCKRLSVSKRIPFFGTTQALISKTSKRKGVQMGSVGYTSAFAQDVDGLFGLDREDLTQPTARLKVIAARNSMGIEVDLTFDLSRGLIEESGGFSVMRSSKVGLSDDD